MFCGEPFAQPGCGKGKRSSRSRSICQSIQHNKVMNSPLEPHCRDADAGLPQFVRIRLPFITQDVRFSRDDECRWESLQLLNAGSQRRGSDLTALARIARVLIPAPHHRVATQVIPLSELEVGCGVEGRVSDW